MLNLDNLREIAAGDEDFVKDVLAVFLKKEEEYSTTLQASIDTLDMEAMRQIVHKIKSSISVLGMEDYRLQLNFLEKGVENGSLEQDKALALANKALADFYKALESSRTMLKVLGAA